MGDGQPDEAYCNSCWIILGLSIKNRLSWPHQCAGIPFYKSERFLWEFGRSDGLRRMRGFGCCRTHQQPGALLI